MVTKTKKFSHKLLALFMAVIMALTCFSGVLTAYGASIKDYHDNNVEYNSLAWDVLSDEQTATALLDYADTMLAEFGPQIDNLLAGLLPSSGMYFYTASSRSIGLNVAGIIKANIKVYTHSVDEIFETIDSVAYTIDRFGSYIGNAGDLRFNSVANTANREGDQIKRSNTSSCDIIRRVLALLQINSGDYNGKDVLGAFLRGEFDLGTVGSLAKIDLYDIIGNALGLDSGYQSDLVYNLVQSLIFNNTNWYTDAEIQNFKNGRTTWVYDTQLLDKLTTELIDKISVLVTYNQEYETPVLNEDSTVSTQKHKVQDTSATRYAAIKAYMTANHCNYATAAQALGYDPNLVYSDEFKDEDGNYQNVLLFAYGSPDANGLPTNATQKIVLTENDSLAGFGYKALKVAWNTVLKGTVKLLHVNYDVNRGHGGNFDNTYYYYMQQVKHQWTGNPAVDYSAANVEDWFEYAYAAYGADDANEFKGWVRHTFEYTRTADADSAGSWKDIDETTLFNKLRYSPLADYYFNMQTGPINLYFMQLGTPNLDAFFANDYDDYTTIVAGLNDALVAVCKDVFVNRSNIIGTVPQLDKTEDIPVINDQGIRFITDTLIGNALKLVKYTADATDANILKAFYNANGGSSAVLTEQNLEGAMLPMLIACIGQINLGSGKLERLIHPADWDSCQDAEAVVFVALREYLSYILPNKDYNALVNITPTSITAKTGTMLQNVVLPMARDAVAYVMQGYVPMADTQGNAWDVYDRPVNDSTTLFDLLNSVICNYADDHQMAKSDDRSMGVASFLGLCDTNGNSTIKTNKTIWQNLDKIVDHILPTFGQLEYASPTGKANTEELIWNGVVLGLLEISDTSIHQSGYGGVSNAVYMILRMISADPIQVTPVVTTVYNFLADMINNFTKARYSNQTKWGNVIPAATSTHPFDDLVHVRQLAGTNGGASQVGAIQKFICRLVEFTGYGTNGVATHPDSMLRGITFALQAVNSFIPEAISNISDHSLKMATATFETPTIPGASGTYAGKVFVTNNSTGVNTAYVDGMNNGAIVQNSRYYIKVTNAEIDGSGACNIASPNNAIVAPGSKLELTTSTKYNPSNATTDPTSSYEVVITYDIVDKDGHYFKDAQGNNLFVGLQTRCYQYMNGLKSWKSVVYDGTNGKGTAHDGVEFIQFPTDLETDTADSSKTKDGYKTFTSNAFGKDKYLNVLYPEYMVVGTSDIAEIGTFGMRVRNTAGKYSVNTQRSIDGVFCFDEDKTVKSNNLTTAVTEYDSNAGLVDKDISNSNAIPVYDKQTGNLLRYGMYDYRVETAAGSGVFGAWQRNQVNEKTHDDNAAITYYKGYTESEIGTQIKAANAAGKKIETRDHVVFELQEALDKKIIQAYHINANGIYDYMYLTKDGGQLAYDNLLNIISMRGPVDGIYMNSIKIKQDKNSSQYFSFLRYDGSTNIQAGSYPVRLNCYNGNNCGYVNFTLVVGDTSSASKLDSAYKELSTTLSNYRPSDFTDYANGQSVTFNKGKDALLNALAAQSAVLTPVTALTLSDKTQLTAETKTTTSELGDLAYQPYIQDVNDSAMPALVKDTAYVGGSTVNGVTYGGVEGVYYFDENCTMPIYSNIPVTGNNLTADAAGVAIAKDSSGAYRLKNAPVMKTTWDFTYGETAPFAKNTNVQATDDDNKPLYKQVQYVYRDANSQKVNSDDVDSQGNLLWKAKFPVTSYALIPNTGEEGSDDNRGIITQAADYITYTFDEVKGKINKSIAETLYQDMTKERTGLNNNNFEVVTLNKMKEAANAAERYYKVILTYTDEYGEPQEKTMSPTDAVAKEKELAGKGIAVTHMTKSDLSSVQVEEYMRLYNFYMSKVVERGYLGNQLEAEIAHSGNTYNKMTVTSEATYDAKGNITAPAVVTKTSSAAAPAYGAWAADGTLVNEGPTIYSVKSWNAYVTALADAITVATTGNASGYPAQNYFNATLANSENNPYKAQVSACYSADSALQIAEIALTPAETALVTVTPVEGATVTVDGTPYTTPVAYEVGETVTIDVAVEPGYVYENVVMINGNKTFVDSTPFEVYLDGDVVIEPVVTVAAPDTVDVTIPIVVATNPYGATKNVGVNGDYTVTAYDEDGEVVFEDTFALSTDDNCVVIALPANGTYTLTIESAYAITREEDITVVVGTDEIEADAVPMVVCDFDGNGAVNALDAVKVYADAAGDGTPCFDLDGSGVVNALDVVIVYACAADDIDLPEVVIE